MMTEPTSLEQLLSSVLQSAPYGIMTFKAVRNSKGDIIDFEWQLTNDTAEQIVNKKKEELIGHRLLDVLPGNKEAGLFDTYKEVVETGRSALFEQFYEADGLERWFGISAVKVGDGFTVTFQDITGSKEAYLKIEQSEKRYRKLFEESLDPILLADTAGTVVQANEAAEQAFETAKKTLAGQPLTRLIHDPATYEDLFVELKNGNKVNELELELRSFKGTIKPCVLNGIQLYDESGEELVGFQLVIRDLAKRKKAEKELVMAEKLSMSGKIARTIAHEIRNPLTNLTLALEQLKDEIPGEVEDADLYFSIIERNADRINNLISELLDSSKPKDLQLIPQSLNDVVKQSVALVADRLKLQNMKLVQRLSHDLPDVQLDADQLKVALLNLLVNAVEAMKADTGKLTIKTSRTGDHQVTLGISDNGKGIPPEDLDKLFEPFYTAKKEGMGLGLTAVQNIIHSHKADIQVESMLGQGTIFQIIFTAQV